MLAKRYYKPLFLLKACFIKCTTKKMAKRKGKKTMSNTVQRLRKKYPQRWGVRHDSFLTWKKERYHLELSELNTTGWEMNCEKIRRYIILHNVLKLNCFVHITYQRRSSLGTSNKGWLHWNQNNSCDISVTHSAARHVPPFCSYHILTSSVIYNRQELLKQGCERFLRHNNKI